MKNWMLFAVLALAGCSGLGPKVDAFNATAKEKGSQAYDDGMANATYWMCDATSVGSLRRWLASDQKKAEAYDTICGKMAVGATLVTPR